jgi:hypothetical protein
MIMKIHLHLTIVTGREGENHKKGRKRMRKNEKEK